MKENLSIFDESKKHPKMKELENLFDKWSQKIKENGDGEYFTKDGILRKNNLTEAQLEQNWFSSEKRVLFLLKDQNQIGWKGNEDIRDWLKDVESDTEKNRIQKYENRNLNSSFIKNIAYLLWGLTKTNHECDWWYDEITQHIEEVKTFFNTQPFALVECKKMPGGGELDDNVLRKHLTDYGCFLKKEINILDPNIIVCTSQYIYDFVVNNLYDTNELISLSLEKHKSLRIHQPSKTLIFCSYHPSTFWKSKDFVYEGVMYHYREFLKSKYSF